MKIVASSERNIRRRKKKQQLYNDTFEEINKKNL
jgi:hypothetical protein